METTFGHVQELLEQQVPLQQTIQGESITKHKTTIENKKVLKIMEI